MCFRLVGWKLHGGVGVDCAGIFCGWGLRRLAGGGRDGGMLKEVEGLLVLQDRDQRLLAIEKELKGMPQEEARAKAKLAGDTAAVEKGLADLRAAELKVKKIAMDVETRRTTIARLQKQQFETKKNDEYNALGKEIERYHKDVDDLETAELEAMEEVDAARAVHDAASGVLRKSEGFVKEELEGIAARRERLEAQRVEVTAERDRLEEGVSEDLLPLYKKLMRSKDGLAIATLRGGQCTGCHMKVISSTVVAVQREEEVVQCENCGRILSMDE